ncbi:hypothetical protein QYF36_025736 [Acer negundo]|nr:hypothetical protein QYF36_025736 [Acer negundo]
MDNLFVKRDKDEGTVIKEIFLLFLFRLWCVFVAAGFKLWVQSWLGSSPDFGSLVEGLCWLHVALLLDLFRCKLIWLGVFSRFSSFVSVLSFCLAFLLLSCALCWFCWSSALTSWASRRNQDCQGLCFDGDVFVGNKWASIRLIEADDSSSSDYPWLKGLAVSFGSSKGTMDVIHPRFTLMNHGCPMNELEIQI